MARYFTLNFSNIWVRKVVVAKLLVSGASFSASSIFLSKFCLSGLYSLKVYPVLNSLKIKVDVSGVLISKSFTLEFSSLYFVFLTTSL